MIDRAALKERIPGWGVDLEPQDRPGVPKESAPPHGTGAHWSTPELQNQDVKIFHTIERNDLTPVYGNTCPPRLLSGQMRKFAYQIGEGKIARWVTLLLADRVDMLEAIVGDVLTGRAGNPFSQMGLGIELKERGENSKLNRIAAVVGVGGIGVVAYMLTRKRLSKGSQDFKRRAA